MLTTYLFSERLRPNFVGKKWEIIFLLYKFLPVARKGKIYTIASYL